MKKAATLFEAAGLADGAPRPLADRLRPSSLAEVVGQDHLLGEQTRHGGLAGAWRSPEDHRAEPASIDHAA